MRSAVLLLLVAAPALAQTPPPPPEPRPVRPRSLQAAPAQRTQRTPEQVRYRFAAQALRNGNTAEAVRVLEDLVADAPGQRAFEDKLVDAYEADGRLDDALALLDRRRQADPVATGALVRRGELLARAGRADEARAAWDAALDAAPGSEMTYRLVSDAQARQRDFDAAAATLEQGREALQRDGLFRLELANLYGNAGDFARSAALYARAVAEDPAAQAGVQGRIRSFLSGAGAPEAFAEAFDAGIAQDPLNAGLREAAAWLATEREDWDGALVLVRSLDRLGGEDGLRLVAFAREALAAGAPDAAGVALDDVLDRHALGPHAPAALLERARIALARSADEGERAGGPAPHGDTARQTLDDFLRRFPGFPEATVAALELGELELALYRNAPRADSLFAVASASRDASIAGRALLARGEAAVAQGDLFDARDRYAEVDEGLRVGPLAEQARYELARLDFYEGLPLSALARVEALDNNTAADVSNDAIALGVTLRESLGLPDDSLHTHLDAFARASLYARRGMGTEALAVLDSLDAAGPGHPLADQQLFLRARTLRALGDAGAALGALGDLATRFPTSFFRDRALRLEADIAQRDLDDPDRARDALDRLLREFPGSLFAPDARARLRALRDPQPDS